jgi:hypothetical protein
MGPKSYDKCPHEKRERKKTHKEGDMKTEVEIGVILLKVQGGQGAGEATGSKRGMEQTLCRSLQKLCRHLNRYITRAMRS